MRANSRNLFITSYLLLLIGFYIGEDNLNGVGGFVPPFFYNWVYSFLRCDRGCCGGAWHAHRPPELSRRVSQAVPARGEHGAAEEEARGQEEGRAAASGV